MGGLYDLGILGSGDNIMALSIIGQGKKSIHKDSTEQYKESICNFELRVSNLRLGYVPGVIRHHYHGSKQNRKYSERWKILVDYMYNPYSFIKLNSNGIIIPTGECPKQLLDDILNYFRERNEDEDFKDIRIDYIEEN